MPRRPPFIILFVVLTMHAALAQVPRDPSLPIDVDVPIAPAPVRGAGASHLFYETVRSSSYGGPP
jgi:hypothetical protein